MAQTIKLKRSAQSGASGIPSTSDLALGEVGINTYHGKMYIKKDDGTESIVEVGSTGSFLPLSGGTLTGNLSLGDNVQLQLGNQTNGDLQIYHDGSHSYIKDAGSGILYVQGSGQVRVGGSDGTTGVEVNEGGDVKLRYNNANKLATTSTGIDVTGSITTDGTVSTGGITVDHTDGTDNISLTPTSSGGVVNVRSSNGTSVIALDGRDGQVKIDVTGSVVADGLTVDGGADASTSYTRFTEHSSGYGFNGAYVSYKGSSNELIFGRHNTFDSNTANDIPVISFARSTGDISFYDSAGSSQNFFWDSSTSRLGLGVTNPSAALDISQSNTRGAYLRSSTTGSRMHFLDATTASVTTVGVGAEGNNMVLIGGGSEILRLNSSGSSTFSGSVTSTSSNIIAGTGTDAIQTFRVGSGNSGANKASINFQNSASNEIFSLDFNNSTGTFDINGDLGGTALSITRAGASTFSNSVTVSKGGSTAAHGDTDLLVRHSSAASTTAQAQILAGNTGYSILYFSDTDSHSAGGFIYNHASNYLATRVNGYEALRLNASGNLGLGCTPSAHAFSKAIQIGDGAVWTVSGNQNSTFASNAYLASNGSFKYIAANKASKINLYNGGFTVATTNTSGSADGDITFTDRLTINSSGNASFSGAVTVGGNVTAATNGTVYAQYFGNSTDTNTLIQFAGSDDIRMRTGGTERLRITDASTRISSGYFMVGKTTQGLTNAGFEVGQSGQASATQSGASCLRLNRLSSDGEILNFNKDGSTVGSISSLSGRMAIGSGNTGLYFDSIRQVLTPHTMTGNTYSATIDLGRSLIPFKDLYLSAAVRWYSGSAQKAYMQYDGTDVVHYGASGVGHQFWSGGNRSVDITSGGDLLVGGTSLDASGSVGFTSGGRIRQVCASGVVNQTLLGAISGVSNGLEITQDASNNQSYIFNIGAIPAVKIESSGSVGIGTSSPSQKLHVVGTSRPALFGSDTAVNIVKLYNSATGSGPYNGLDLLVNSTSNTQIKSYGMPLTFGTSASNGTNVTERMRLNADGSCRWTPDGTNHDMTLTSGGNLLVGVTSPQDFDSTTTNGHTFYGESANVALHSRNNANPFALQRTGNDGSICNFYKDTTKKGNISVSAYGMGFGGGTRSSDFFIKTDGTASFASGVNLGVGTGSPSSYLPEGSNLVVADSSHAGITIASGTTSEGGIFFADGTSSTDRYMGMIRYNHASNYMEFRTSAGERARITSGGTLLIGTTGSATYASTVNEGVEIAPDFIGVSRDQNTVMHLNRLTNDGTIVDFRTAGFVRGSVSISGSTTSYNTSSDERLKDNIKDADDSGSKVDAIQVRQFDWKADGEHQDYGMVAQELLEVAPDAVTQGDTPDDMMGVDYSKLVPMLIKEIQSLRQRVAQLEE